MRAKNILQKKHKTKLLVNLSKKKKIIFDGLMFCVMLKEKKMLKNNVRNGFLK